MTKNIPKTICPAPWLSIGIDVDGTCRPCCKLQLWNTKRDFGNLKTHSLEQLWNSDGMVSLREDFLAGKKPGECSQCWDEEEVGITSLRQEFTKHRINPAPIPFESSKPKAPIVLDLKLSSLCNLKCRICSPRVSSLFLKESIHFDEKIEPGLRENQEYFTSNKITDHEENLATFKSWLPNLEHVEMFGGEPLLSQENREIEKLMINAGVAKGITLLYNTNITTFNEGLVKTWQAFKHTTICLSLDDIGERQEFQRFPSKWNITKKNLDRFTELQGDRIGLVFICSVSNYNIWYLPEYLSWLTENYPTIYSRFNIVHGDAELCVSNLPDAVKSLISEKFAMTSLTDESKVKLAQVSAFMNSKPMEGHLWKLFLERTAKLDRRRNQSYSECFPEFYSLLEKNGALPIST